MDWSRNKANGMLKIRRFDGHSIELIAASNHNSLYQLRSIAYRDRIIGGSSSSSRLPARGRVYRKKNVLESEDKRRVAAASVVMTSFRRR